MTLSSGGKEVTVSELAGDPLRDSLVVNIDGPRLSNIPISLVPTLYEDLEELFPSVLNQLFPTRPRSAATGQ